MKKILSIILTVCILAASLSCTAAAASITPMERYSQTKTDEISEYTYISDANMQKLLSIKKSNSALIDYIFDEFSCEKMKYSPQYENLVSPDFEIGEIIFKDSYCVVSEDGECIEVPKDICYKMMEDEEVSVNREASVSTLNSDISNSETTESANGYMRTSVSAICDKNGKKGSYLFIAVFEWLKMPLIRLTDAISLASTTFTWDNLSDSSYNLSFLSQLSQTNSEGVTNIYEYADNITGPEDPIQSTGFYYKFNLPNNALSSSGDSIWTAFVFVLSASGRVTNYGNIEQQLSVTAKYAHSQIKVPLLGFSWDTNSGSSLGVSIRGDLHSQYYGSYLSWDYSEHYHLY